MRCFVSFVKREPLTRGQREEGKAPNVEAIVSVVPSFCQRESLAGLWKRRLPAQKPEPIGLM